MNNMILRSNKKLISLSCGFLFLLLVLFANFSGDTTLEVLYSSSRSTTGQLYWKSDKMDFSENMTVSFPITAGFNNSLSVALPSIMDDITALRFDPAVDSNVQISVSRVYIVQPGFKPIIIPLNTIKPFFNIVNYSLSKEIAFQTIGNDSMLMIELHNASFAIDKVMLALCVLLSIGFSICIFLLLGLFNNVTYPLGSVFVISALSVVLGLTVSLSISAKYNASPDENDHFLGSEYFRNNSSIPNAGDESCIYTYNPQWDYSRAYQKGVHYLLAGKFSKIFGDAVTNYKAVRLFGAFCILLLLLAAIRFPSYSILLIPYLLTPQIWYIHSYINDDYFPLFVSFVLVLFTEVGKNILIQAQSTKKIFLIIFLGTLLGLMFISKNNFIVVYAFYIIYLLSIFIEKPFSLKSIINMSSSMIDKYKTAGVILLLGLGVVLLSEIPSLPTLQVSPESKSFLQQAELNKNALFASGISGESRFGSYVTMLENWIPSSFNSFNGGYGYMRYFASSTYYLVLFAFQLLATSYIVYLLVKLRNKQLYILVCFSFIAFVSILFNFRVAISVSYSNI